MHIYTSYLTTLHQPNKPSIRGVTTAPQYSRGKKSSSIESVTGCNHRGNGNGKGHVLAFHWRHREGEEV
jgi:hypothetical protein